MRKHVFFFVLWFLGICWFAGGTFAGTVPERESAGTLPGNDCGITLSGTVTNHEDRSPLIGATVVLEGTERASVTDANGHYHFHDLCPGTYKLVVSYIGYASERLEKNMRAPEVVNFRLHPDGLLLRSVEVRGAKQKEQVTQASSQLSGRELDQAQGQSLAQSLERLTGLSSLQTGPSIAKPVIHGLHSNRILVMNNGVRHEAQQWGSEHAPEIDPFVANQLTVIKGAAGVRYGADAIGGVILVEPKPLRDSAGVSGELNLVGVSNNRQGVASAMAEGNVAAVPPLAWRLQGSVKKAGNSKAPNYYLENTGYTERNFSAAVGWEENRRGAQVFFSQFQTRLGVFSDSHVGNLTDIRNAIARGKPENEGQFTYTIDRPFQEVSHSLLKISGFQRTGTTGKLSFTYGGQFNQREEYDNHSDASRPELRFSIQTHTAELLWEHGPFLNLTGSVGANYLYQLNAYTGRFFVPEYDTQTAGLFWIERWQKGHLQLEGGLRYDYRVLNVEILRRNTPQRTGQQDLDNVLLTPEHTFQNLTATLGAIYDFGPHVHLSLNVSSAWRSPTASELYSNGIHHGTGTYELGDASLGVERGYNFVATLGYVQNARLNGEVSVYRNYINNFIYLEPDPEPTLTIRGAFLTARQRQANATITGLDLNATYQLTGNLLLETRNSLVRGFNRSAKEYLIWMPADRFTNSLRYELAQLGRSGNLRNNFFSVGGTYVARQRSVPENYLLRDYALPPAGYFLLHAEAGTTVRVGQHQVEIGLIGRNLLNTEYRDYLNRFRYYAAEVGRNITVRFSIPF